MTSRLDETEGEFSLTVSRALKLLCTFDRDRRELGISELSRDLGLSKPTVQRLVHALLRHGFLEQDQGTRKYRVGVQAFRVGSLFADCHRLERVALPSMQVAVQETGVTCYLSVLRKDEMIIVAALEGPGPIRHSIPIGGRLALHSSAVGKAALSALSAGERDAMLDLMELPALTANTIVDRDRLRREIHAATVAGYSLNWEENNPGVASVAAPIRNGDGALTAVISVGFASSQIPRRRVPELGRLLIGLAEAIAEKLADTNSRRVA